MWRSKFFLFLQRRSLVLSFVYAVENIQDFPEVWAPTCDFAKCSQKLHEIERIWTGGGTSLAPLRSATDMLAFVVFKHQALTCPGHSCELWNFLNFFSPQCEREAGCALRYNCIARMFSFVGCCFPSWMVHTLAERPATTGIILVRISDIIE